MEHGTILLAHGIFGFGSPMGRLPLLNYFNGVALHLRQQGHRVLTPHVDPIGSVEQRGDKLASFILKQVPEKKRVLHIIAHSMGGLDARHAITNVPGVAERVATLVTIGTPHRGSPVADMIAAGKGPLLHKIPSIIFQGLKSNLAALNDLTTAIGVEFDKKTPDANGVRYFNIAGDASRAGHQLLLFQLAEEIGQITGEVNDGVVTRSSAHRPGHKHLEDWPFDHAGEVGWSLSSPVPILFKVPRIFVPEHLRRYEELVKKL
jgi:triacylglycerol lipase